MPYLEESKPFVGATLTWAIPTIELVDLGITELNAPTSFTYKVTGVSVDDPGLTGDFEYNATDDTWEAIFNAPTVPGVYAMWAHAILGASDGKWNAHFQVLPFHGS